MKTLLEILILVALNLVLFGYVHRKMVMLILAQGQQLAVFKRTVKKPKIKERDRIFWMILSKIWASWRYRLVIVRPETVIKWSQRRFRDYWRAISKAKGKVGRPPITDEHIDFIRRISSDHPNYGADRIAGILMVNFGVKHSASTVQKYMVKAGDSSRGKQQWGTFLKNEASGIWCCDFMVQYTFFFTGIYIFIIMELESRKVVHFGVTEHPTLEWVKQQIKHATPLGVTPRFLIHDNDAKFGQERIEIINEKTGRSNTFRCNLDFWLSRTMGIEGIPIPYGAPNANAHQERLCGTVRRECLDQVIIFNERHLQKIMKEYVNWYNHGRFHQGLNGIPDAYPELKKKPAGWKIVAIPVLNGLHHDYRLAA